MLEKIFKLSENKTDVKTEILAGITTFMTMALSVQFWLCDGCFHSVIDLQALFALPYALTQAHTWLGVSG